ncbi:MAG: monooxygenase [Nannocystis sp.]|nr:hypothetical protein [Nannocystis sp.]MBK9757852.1 monooxygenase [Nannocystis sp.]
MPLTPLRALPLALVLAACGPDTGDDTGAPASTGDPSTTQHSTSGDAPTSGDASTGEPSTGEPVGVTYYRDIKPLLDARCVQCHSAGNIAPFALTTHAEAAPFAAMLSAAADAGTMPPWPPDPACRAYAHDVTLTPEQRDLLREWTELGAPAGDPASEPPGDDTPGDDVVYDVELQLPAPYLPTITPDEYRCFLLDWPKAEDTFVTALDVVPGERQIVHHVITYAIEPQDVDAYHALEDADPDPGYVCYGGPGASAESVYRVPWLSAWAPGTPGGAMPAGTGLRVQPGSVIAVQMHYHGLPGAKADQSKIRIRTASKVDRPAVIMPFTNLDWVLGSEPMHIPAGDPDVMLSHELDITPYLTFLFPKGPFKGTEPFVVHAAGTHQHTLGTKNKLSVVRKGGTGDECLLEIPRWDFNWQGTYPFAATATVHPGDRLRLECHWDNSAANQPVVDGVQQPAKDLGWGEGTGDEMCLGMLYVTAQ